MRPLLATVAAVPALLALAAAVPAGEADLPVASVALFTSGVGWFEHAGKVQGEAAAELRFRTAQINDVLKSLVLQDLDGGTIGTVGYPSQDPLEKTLKSFQVDLSGNPPLPGLLAQLRGAEVRVEALDVVLTGVVLGVEAHTVALAERAGTTTAWTLNLLVDGGIRPVALTDVRSLTPTDVQLRGELARALTAVAAARDQDRKPVHLRFRGQGERRVRVAYVAEAPVWKASYRLLLGDGKAHVQAWAIVENPTESDWNDVRLTLVSGRPISFIQDLYQPLYAQRPTVATELQAGLRPVAYGGGQALRNEVAGLQEGRAAESARGRAMQKAAAPAAPAAGRPMAFAADEMAMESLAPFDATSSIQVATEAAAGVGELFTYRVGTVSIPRQRSAMIPFVGADVPMDRVSIYNRAVLARHPLAGARLANRTGLHLTAGPVTVYDDGTYAGDAQLTALPPGQTRLVSFAVDQRVLVDSETATGSQTRVVGKIVRGVLHVQITEHTGRTYALENQGDVAKTVLVEHPRTGGAWALHETPKPTETTDQLYRFEVAVPAQGKAQLAVSERMLRTEHMQLLDGDGEQIAVLLRGPGLSPALKEALIRVRTLVDAWRTAERARDENQRQINALMQDQERIRRNLGTINQNSEFGRDQLAKMAEHEKRIDGLRLADVRLGDDIAAKRKQLADHVAGLTVE